MKTYTTDALPNQLATFLQHYSWVYRAALVDAIGILSQNPWLGCNQY